MKFNLLLTNRYRVRWLLWILLGYTGICLLLLGVHFRPAFWGLLAIYPTLLLLLVGWNKLFRQPGWVLLEADGIIWANPATDATYCVLFTELHAYRFAVSRNGVALRLCLRNGELVRFEGRLDVEFATLWQAFDQAVRRYNQANPGVEIEREKEALEKFFTRRIATRALFGLLALSVAWVLRCFSREASAVSYLPLGLLLPYSAVWANYRYDRR